MTEDLKAVDLDSSSDVRALLIVFSDAPEDAAELTRRCAVVSSRCVASHVLLVVTRNESQWRINAGVGTAISGHASLTQLLVDACRRWGAAQILFTTDAAHTPWAWDARLLKIVVDREDIALASALCVGHPLIAPTPEPTFSMETNIESGSAGEIDVIDAAAYCVSARTYLACPVAHPFATCATIDALTCLLASEAEDFDVRLATDASYWIGSLGRAGARNGLQTVVADHIVVDPMQQCTPADAERVDVRAFRAANPLGGTQRAIGQYVISGVAALPRPGLDARPVQLHVMHFWGGGLDKWVREFAAADEQRINLLFTSYRIGETGGQRLALYADESGARPVRVWDIAQPIQSTLVSSLEYRSVIEEIVRDYAVDAIIVSSLIGHTLDALSIPLPTIVVAHDYFPVCQAINPSFRGKVCKVCDTHTLTDCQTNNPLNQFFSDQGPSDWIALRRAFVGRLVSRNIPLIAPSKSVIESLVRLESSLRTLPLHVVPHSHSLSLEPLPLPVRVPNERLRLVVLGQLRGSKGAELLRTAASALQVFADVHLLGCGEEGARLAKSLGWAYTQSFEPTAVRGLMRDIAPHAGLLLSVVPETFSYTLSELFDLGVPPVATGIGAFADRIIDGQNGFLFEPTGEALLTTLKQLSQSPESLLAVANYLRMHRTPQDAAEMVSRYHQLLPISPLSVARYRLGRERQTALTEPYEKLTAAYAQVFAAYGDTAVAYRSASAAEAAARRDAVSESKRLALAAANYDRARNELLTTAEAGRREVAAIDVKRHPWRAWTYLRRVRVHNAALELAARSLPGEIVPKAADSEP